MQPRVLTAWSWERLQSWGSARRIVQNALIGLGVVYRFRGLAGGLRVSFSILFQASGVTKLGTGVCSEEVDAKMSTSGVLARFLFGCSIVASL